FSRIDRNTNSRSPGDFEMRRKSSEVAVSRSNASSRSRVRRASSVSWPTDSGALRRFGVTALWRCDLARSPPVLERRRIAHPRLRTTPIFKVDYSRELRPVEWGSGVAHVAFGSKADIEARPGNVRITPESRR